MGTFFPNAASLAAELSRALYAADGSNYGQVPIGVVVPKSVDDIIATLAACRRH